MDSTLQEQEYAAKYTKNAHHSEIGWVGRIEFKRHKLKRGIKGEKTNQHEAKGN